MPAKPGNDGQKFYGSEEQAQQLAKMGIFDAQTVTHPHAELLTSDLGMQEVAKARKRAERIAEETGLTARLYGSQIARVVGFAAAAETKPENEDLARKVEAERAELYERMERTARAAGSTALQQGN